MIATALATLERPPVVTEIAHDPADDVDWEQTRYVTTDTRWNVVACSRRAGKTRGAIRRAVRCLIKRPRARVLYIHHTLVLAREQFWVPLCAWLDDRGVVYDSHDGTMTMRFRGGVLYVKSCDDVGGLKRFRGDQWDLVMIDEVQEHEENIIAPLIEQALLPSLADRAGSLDVLGTPPDAGEVGYLWDRYKEATDTLGSQWRAWHWTLRNNPYFPQGEIDAVCRVRGIGPGHPIYEREFEGRFVSDAGLRVYEYEPGRNDMTAPHEGGEGWQYAMGVDLGFQDCDAIVVFGWRRTDGQRQMHEVYSWCENHLDVDALAKVYRDAIQKWRPRSVVGDTGGHGAVKVLKTLEQRLGGYPIMPKPVSVADSVALYNDDMRTGRIRLNPDGQLAADSKKVVWKVTNGKREIGKKFHSDLTEAARYAHHGATHFMGKASPPALDPVEQRHRDRQARKRADADPYNPMRPRR